MNMDEKTFEALRDEHMDAMIALAFKTMAEEEARRAAEEFDREEKAEEKAACERAYAQYQEKRRRIEASEKRRRNLSALRKIAVNTFKVAACIALVITISVPIAIANVESLRTSVLRLLITQDEEQGAARVYMATDEELTFNVPEGWLGEYYMTYIPEGIEVQYISTFSGYVEYWDSEGIKLSFDEYGVGASAYLDNENAETWYTTVRGNDAYVISKNDRYTIVWAIEDRYFNVMVWRSTYDEALRIAEGVRKIIVEKN